MLDLRDGGEEDRSDEDLELRRMKVEYVRVGDGEQETGDSGLLDAAVSWDRRRRTLVCCE